MFKRFMRRWLGDWEGVQLTRGYVATWEHIQLTADPEGIYVWVWCITSLSYKEMIITGTTCGRSFAFATLTEAETRIREIEG